MKVMPSLSSKIIFFIIIVFGVFITLDMYNNFKENNNINQCKVEFDSSGGNYIASQTFQCGKKIKNYLIPQKDGYIFDGWYLNDEKYDFDKIVLDNIILIAKWRVKNTIDTNVSVNNVKILTSKYQMKKNDQLKLEVKVEPVNATNKNVYYTSSDLSVAIVNESGMVIAKKSGIVEIAVVTADGGYKDSIKITITSPVEGVKLNTSNVELGLKDTYILKASLTPNYPDNANVTWSSSNTSVAKVENGKVTAVGIGTAIITVTTKDGGYKATAKITVKDLTTNVTLNKNTIQLIKGESTKLNATITPKNINDKTLIWTSSNSNIATVDSNGNILAKSPGVAKITVKTKIGTTATCLIYVTSLSITNGSATIPDESTYKLKATLTGKIGTEKIIWTSSNSNIATVDSNGNIKAKAVGTAVITASITTLNNKTITSNQFKITVRPVRILMVGNSKTYQSHLSTYVANIANKEGYSVEGITYNNYTENALANYPGEDSTTNITYFRDTGGKTLGEIAIIHKKELNQLYDYVVIQERTEQYAKTNDSEYYKGVLNVLDIVYKQNPKIKMYIRKTWVLFDSSTKKINQAYTNTANVVNNAKNERGYNITIINDGPAMYDAISKKYEVIKNDNRHQTYLGGYLAASCVYSTLFNQDPTTIKYKPKSLDEKDIVSMRNISKSYCYK